MLDEAAKLRRERAKRAIHGLVDTLAEPLAPSEIACGWDEDNRLFFVDYLQSIATRLDSPEPFSFDREMTSIARVMDHSGIECGELLERGAKLSLILRRVC